MYSQKAFDDMIFSVANVFPTVLAVGILHFEAVAGNYVVSVLAFVHVREIGILSGFTWIED